jgi:hypothetical protein
MATVTTYPWFSIVSGDELEQGDMLENCPVFQPPEDLTLKAEIKLNDAKFKWDDRDLIIMSQSCDISKGREKIQEILLCAVWKRSELKGDLASDKGLEEARKGRIPAVHVLAASSILGFDREVRIVDFRQIHTLPIGFVRRRASMTKRIRLLPPYREHLSQSFARFFMRVGLPIDIPSFSSKKK